MQPPKSAMMPGKGYSIYANANSGGQEMAAVMQMLVFLMKMIGIRIIAAISWLPPLISQLFHPGLFAVTPFFTAWLFCHRYHFFL